MEVIKGLIPPHEGDEAVYRWRVTLAIFIGVNTMANVVHIAWACGWLSFAGLNGFVLKDAYAADLQIASSKQSGIEVRVVETQRILVQEAIKEALKTRCISILQNNQASLDSANHDVAQYEDQYYALSGRAYQERPCSEILIAKIP